MFFACFLPSFFYGQKANKKSIYWSLSPHYGYIMEHRNSMGHLVQGHIGGAEVSGSVPSYDKHLWEYENNFPEKGFALYWFTLGNPEQLGNIFAAAPYMEIPLREKAKKSRVYMRLGFGVAYATRRFDPIENHKNNVISAPVNGFVNMKFMWKRELSEKLRLDYGVALSHASNGKIKVPNLGLNLATLNVSLVFKTTQKPEGEMNFPTFVDSSTKRLSKHELYWISSLGFTSIYPVGGRKYLAQTHTMGYYLNVRNTHKWGAGVDLYYNPANKVNSLVEDSIVVSSEQNVQFGVKVGWAYNLGRISFPIEMGYYVKTTWKEDGLFFHRIGVRYYLKNNMILQVGLKSHWARADYFEYGIGYRFPLKKK